MLLSLLIPLAMAGDLADLTHVTIGYGAALSEVVHDTAGWSDADLEAAALSEDWRTAHQARVVLAWRANAETAALYWQLQPVETRADGLYRFPEGVEEHDAVLLDRLLHADEAPEVRGALVLACALSDWDETEALYELMVDEPDAGVRELHVYAMKRSPDGLPGLRLGLADPDPTVRTMAARAAASHERGAELVPELRRALGDSDAGVRSGAARSLGLLQVPGVGAELRPLLRDPEAQVRLDALRALERLGLATPVAPELVADPDPRVARVARRITAAD